jgi:tocopherol cyclase
MFQLTRDPARYHGLTQKPPFFEGWYYRMTDKNRLESVVVIPGIYIHKNPAESTSFIQVVDGINLKNFYITFPVDAFRSEKRKFNISIGGNSFSSNSFSLDLNREDLRVNGTLHFRFMNPWPVSLSSPGIMGWYAWVPFMECFHGVISLDHSIEGSLELDGREIDFSGGKGYIEKDWGRAFPEAWIWQQSNHFGEEGVSLTASIAIIPWIGKAFPGFIIGFLWEKELYRFATYTGARTTLLETSDKTIHWIVEDKKYMLEMFTEIGPATFLRAPTPRGMDRQIRESVDSLVEVRLYRKIKTGRTVVFQGKGNQAGFEMEGNISKLLQMVHAG